MSTTPKGLVSSVSSRLRNVSATSTAKSGLGSRPIDWPDRRVPLVSHPATVDDGILAGNHLGDLLSGYVDQKTPEIIPGRRAGGSGRPRPPDRNIEGAQSHILAIDVAPAGLEKPRTGRVRTRRSKLPLPERLDGAGVAGAQVRDPFRDRFFVRFRSGICQGSSACWEGCRTSIVTGTTGTHLHA